jgi:HEAT repeat protein
VETRTEKLPLDARLLSRVVIELNIARRVIALYPGSHDLVQNALDKAYESLQELFELRPSTTLSVARETLFVDEYFLERKNPVFREFALALSKLNIARITFVKGTTREELYGLHHFLCADTGGLTAAGLRELLERQGFRNLRVELVDFRSFTFFEGRAARGDDATLMERYIKGCMDGTLLPADVQELVAGVPPEQLAENLNRAGGGTTHPEAYDRVITSYLRSSAEPSYTSRELGRLFDFINRLRPELKKEFLSAAIRPLGTDLDELRRSLEGVPVDSVIALLGSINETGLTIPKALRDLIAKFSQLAPGKQERAPGALDALADDFLLSAEIMTLLREDEKESLNPAAYREEIRSLIENSVAAAPLAARQEAAAGWGPEIVGYSYGQAMLEVLSSPDKEAVDGSHQTHFAAVLGDLADEAAQQGHYGQLLEMLEQLRVNRGRRRQAPVATAVLEHCNSPDFIAALVASLRQYGRAERVAATLVCERYGAAIVGPLYDLLAEEQSRSVRRFLLGLIARLGDAGLPESLQRLADPRWYVRRNILYVFGETGASVALAAVEVCGRDPDPRVRLEAARCLVRAGRASGVEVLRQLLRDPDPAVAGPAARLAGWLRVAALVPELQRLLETAPRGSEGDSSRTQAVRALGRIGTPAAEVPLRAILAQRNLLRRSGLADLKTEATRALRAAARRREPADPAPADAGAADA